MKKVIASAVAICLASAGCATSSKDVSSSYVSPLQYQSYDCDQIGAEMGRVQVRVKELGGRLDTASANDAAIVGVGLLLFWPALFFVGGTKQQEAEYGRLKGEYDALQQSAIAKKCALTPLPNTAATVPETAVIPVKY